METAVWFLGLRGSNICLSTWKYQRRNPHKTRENETISSASDFGSSERIFLDSLYNRSYCSFKCFNMLFFIFLIGSETWITRLTKVQPIPLLVVQYETKLFVHFCFPYPLSSAGLFRGWRVTGGGWRVAGGGWGVAGDGWRVTGGGWRVKNIYENKILLLIMI